MISFLISSTLMLSLMIMFIKHPLSMGLTILAQSLLITLLTGMLYHNYWFSYLLFIIMVGGLMVLFIYMTSIASNEMFKFSTLIMLIFIPLMIIFFQMNQTNKYSNLNSIKMNESTMTPHNLFAMTINKYMNFPSNVLLMFMVIFLFITLIAVVKITSTSHGPLRQDLLKKK